MASDSSMFRKLNMSPQAIKKREFRVVEKEKKRRRVFINGYIRIKYPQQFNEANRMYAELSARYPNKLDLTKSYYFQKWATEIKKTENPMLIPHLPILMPSVLLQQVQQPEVQPAVHQPEVQLSEVQPPEVQQPEVQPAVHQPEVQLSEVQPPEVQQPEVQPAVHQPEVQLSEVQPPEVQQTVEVETTEVLDLTSGMSLSEMSLAVEELTKALQSDRELMDIIEGFDLPDSVWDNELAVPNYIDEEDLLW